MTPEERIEYLEGRITELDKSLNILAQEQDRLDRSFHRCLDGAAPPKTVQELIDKLENFQEFRDKEIEALKERVKKLEETH